MIKNMILYFKIWFRLCFVFCFIFFGACGESLLRKAQPLSTSNTFDSSIHSIYTAADAWCTDSASAESTYGHISNWNISGIFCMYLRFRNRRASCSGTFTENIMCS